MGIISSNQWKRMLLVLLVIDICGCQTIPKTQDKSAVIQKVFNYDPQLSKITPDTFALLDHTQPLTENDAVILALNQNAAFLALLTDLKIAKADLVHAGMLPNPELLFAFGVTNKPYRYAIDLPVELLWTRPIRVRAMKQASDAVAYKLIQSGLNLIKDVRIGYAQAVLSQEYLQVTQYAYQLRHQIFNIALKRLDAGDISNKEMLIAKNDADLAKRDWEIAQYEVNIKMQRLSNLIGSQDGLNNIPLQPYLIPACTADETEKLLRLSLEQRPDIISAKFAVRVAEEKLNLSKVDWFRLNATADATSGQVNGHTLGPAIRSTLPIGNQNQGAISKAGAEVEKAQLTLNALLQQASLEINTSHLQYQQTCHDWQILQTSLIPNAQQMRQRTEQAYLKGEISYLQTLEVNRQLLDTQIREVQLKADLISKLAELNRSSAFDRDTPLPSIKGR